jgi:hypothetical protein
MTIQIRCFAWFCSTAQDYRYRTCYFQTVQNKIKTELFEHIFDSVSVRAQTQHVRKYYSADIGGDTKQQRFLFFKCSAILTRLSVTNWVSHFIFHVRDKIY